ncbi:MAG: CvpA family protein [Acutalibacteraceae bacterium]
MGLFIDLGVLAVLLLFIIIGFSRGAVKTLLNLLCTVGAFLFSVWAGQLAANWIYNTFIKTNLLDNMQSEILKSTGDTTAAASSALNAVPDFIVNLFSNFGISINQIITGSESTAENIAKSTAAAVESAVAPVIIAVISVAAIICLFIILSVFLRFVSSLISKVFKLPVLNAVNRLFGGAFGLLEGCLIVCFAVFLIKLWAPESNAQELIFNAQNIDSSALFKFFYNIVPNISQSGAAAASAVQATSPALSAGAN